MDQALLTCCHRAAVLSEGHSMCWWLEGACVAWVHGLGLRGHSRG